MVDEPADDNTPQDTPDLKDTNSLLTPNDLELCTLSLLKKNPQGLHEDEINRRLQFVTAEVADWKLGKHLYELFLAGKILLDVADDGSVRISTLA